METLILCWYILVETQSVLALTVFASLQYLGTLISPILGVLADRIGRRVMLCGLRAIYLTLSILLMILALIEVLSPMHVFIIAFLAGLARPSDLVMRNALIGDTMPEDQLMKAMGISRTTLDSARVAGAVIGAGLFSQLGMGPAYIVITAFYGVSFALTFGVSSVRRRSKDKEYLSLRSSWKDLKYGLSYVWTTPTILAAIWLAFLVNLTVFPITHGVLPYIAKEIYMIDENGLGHLVASYATGALFGSITMTLIAPRSNPARFMIVNIWLMYMVLLVFGQLESKYSGQFFLLLIGYIQSLSMISMVVTLLYMAGEQFRGLVMGVRMLAVYGLPIGLMASGLFIDWLGFKGTVFIYSIFGLAVSVLIVIYWRRQIWFRTETTK